MPAVDKSLGVGRLTRVAVDHGQVVGEPRQRGGSVDHVACGVDNLIPHRPVRPVTQESQVPTRWHQLIERREIEGGGRAQVVVVARKGVAFTGKHRATLIDDSGVTRGRSDNVDQRLATRFASGLGRGVGQRGDRYLGAKGIPDVNRLNQP